MLWKGDKKNKKICPCYLPKKIWELLQPCAAAPQEAAEGFSEGNVTQSVAAGVYRAVYVAQPVSCGPQEVRNIGVAESSNNCHDVVRCPGEDENQEDGQDGLGDPLLPCHHSPLPPPLQP